MHTTSCQQRVFSLLCIGGCILRPTAARGKLFRWVDVAAVLSQHHRFEYEIRVFSYIVLACNYFSVSKQRVELNFLCWGKWIGFAMLPHTASMQPKTAHWAADAFTTLGSRWMDGRLGGAHSLVTTRSHALLGVMGADGVLLDDRVSPPRCGCGRAPRSSRVSLSEYRWFNYNEFVFLV